MKKISKFISKVLRVRKGEITFFKKFDLGAESLTSPICEDINGNSKIETILSNTKGEIFVFSEDCELEWRFSVDEGVSAQEETFLDIEKSNSVNHTPVITDFFKNGKKQILFGTEYGTVYLVNSKGRLIWKYKTNHPIRGGINTFELKSNGKQGIIFGSSDKRIYILSIGGKLLKKLRNDAEIESTPMVIDNKIIFGDTKGRIKSLGFDGEVNWVYKTKDKILTKPVLVKLYNAEEAILVGGADKNLYCLSLEGKLIWKFETKGSLYSEPLILDINKDSLEEAIFSSADGNIYVIDLNGNYIWSYETDFRIIGKPVTEDFTKDGKLEVIAGSYDKNIYVLNGKGIRIMRYVPGISGIVAQNGSCSDIPSNIPGEIIGDKIFSYNAGGLVIGCAVIKNKIIVQTKEGETIWLNYENN